MSKKVVELKPPTPDHPARFLTRIGLVSGRFGKMPHELARMAEAFEHLDGTPPLYLVGVEVVMPGLGYNLPFLLLRMPEVMGYTAGEEKPSPP